MGKGVDNVTSRLQTLRNYNKPPAGARALPMQETGDRKVPQRYTLADFGDPQWFGGGGGWARRAEIRGSLLREIVLGFREAQGPSPEVRQPDLIFSSAAWAAW